MVKTPKRTTSSLCLNAREVVAVGGAPKPLKRTTSGSCLDVRVVVVVVVGVMLKQ